MSLSPPLLPCTTHCRELVSALARLAEFTLGFELKEREKGRVIRTRQPGRQTNHSGWRTPCTAQKRKTKRPPKPAPALELPGHARLASSRRQWKLRRNIVAVRMAFRKYFCDLRRANVKKKRPPFFPKARVARRTRKKRLTTTLPKR